MLESIPWTIQRLPEDDLAKANDLSAEGWQPFAVTNGFIYFRRMGTTLERTKIPICCGTCKYFAQVGINTDNNIAYGRCELRKHSTNEEHVCDQYESIYV